MMPLKSGKHKGVVSCHEPIMTAEGEGKFFYGTLEILPEAELCGFVPKEDCGWYIVIGGKVLIPGCQLRGIAFMATKPARKEIIEP